MKALEKSLKKTEIPLEDEDKHILPVKGAPKLFRKNMSVGRYTCKVIIYKNKKKLIRKIGMMPSVGNSHEEGWLMCL